MPLVSIITCTYNDVAYIGEAIESILNQTYQNIEFIIINDGSTDATKDIILSYKSKKIRYFENAGNKGQEFSKNLGLSKANGKYIAYQDGDDFSVENRIETQLAFMETHPDIGLCSTAVDIFGLKNKQVYTSQTDKDIRMSALFSTPMAHPTFMIRKSILDEHEIKYVPGFLAAEDYLFVLKLLNVTKAYSIQKLLYCQRWHGKNISIEKGEVQKANFRRISNKAFKQLMGIELSDSDHHLVYDFFRGNIELKDINRVKQVLNLVFEKTDNHSLATGLRKQYYRRQVPVHRSKLNNRQPAFVSFLKTGALFKLPLSRYWKFYLRLLWNSVYYRVFSKS